MTEKINKQSESKDSKNCCDQCCCGCDSKSIASFLRHIADFFDSSSK